MISIRRTTLAFVIVLGFCFSLCVFGEREVVKDPRDKKIEAAIESGLQWLAKAQEPGGSWDPKKWGGNSDYVSGLTGLALYALVCAGHTTSKGKYSENVSKAVLWLKNKQTKNGNFAPKTTMYNHAIPTLALARLLRLEENVFVRDMTTNGVKYMVTVQNDYKAWRYWPKSGDNDTSVRCWCTKVLWEAKSAAITFYVGAWAGVKTFLDEVTEPNTGEVGYTSRPIRGAADNEYQKYSMTACGLLIRMYLGASGEDKIIKKGVKILTDNPPQWYQPGISAPFYYYWFFGTEALRFIGGRQWRSWRAVVSDLLISRQNLADARLKGSWDPTTLTHFCNMGGRVYSSSIALLTLLSAKDKKGGGVLPIDDRPTVSFDKPLPERAAVAEAIKRSMKWFAVGQEEAGNWDARTWGGNADYESGLTGLALLALAECVGGNGDEGSRKAITNAILWLEKQQTKNGNFSPKGSMYNHVVSLYALLRTLRDRPDDRVRRIAKKGLEYMLSIQNEGKAWRYWAKDGDNDTSVTSWCVMAMKEAETAGFKVPDKAWKGVEAFLEEVTDFNSGVVGYVKRPTVRKPDAAYHLYSMTACGMTCRLLMGASPNDRLMRLGRDILSKNLPSLHQPGINQPFFYYWYFGTKAMSLTGGEKWKEWRKRAVLLLVDQQVKKRKLIVGTWDVPNTYFGQMGGRLYTTALGAMTLRIALDNYE